MGMPAARLGDMTATADVITAPCVPNVLIAGQPASVLGDSVNGPGVVGVVSSLVSASVLIGGRPAARMGAMVTGANPASGAPVTTPITTPCAPTVLIGG